ncbi:hypothetical protein CVE36_02685, partial [Pseudomonas syringae pv. actinidiae]|nr:hypothetical protein [Pseudomonas syringae pv. actinidiae]
MCGRYSIYESMDHYLKELAPEQIVINGYDLLPIERYNVAPSTRVEIIRPTEGGLSVDKVRWGWEPFWAKGKRPAPINARVETVMTGKFFKELWPTGRAVAPANGWFEWVKDPDDPKKKQPYFIRLKSKKPMFFAALAQVHRGLEPHDGDGFVIITSASDSGMVDIHDRRPVVLTAEDARAWLDSKTNTAESRSVGQKSNCRIVDDFEWFSRLIAQW